MVVTFKSNVPHFWGQYHVHWQNTADVLLFCRLWHRAKWHFFVFSYNTGVMWPWQSWCRDHSSIHSLYIAWLWVLWYLLLHICLGLSHGSVPCAPVVHTDSNVREQCSTFTMHKFVIVVSVETLCCTVPSGMHFISTTHDVYMPWGLRTNSTWKSGAVTDSFLHVHFIHIDLFKCCNYVKYA